MLIQFRKVKSYSNNFWVVVIKNGHRLLGHGALKSDFLHADTNLGKIKVTLIIIGWVWSTMVRPFRSQD